MLACFPELPTYQQFNARLNFLLPRMAGFGGRNADRKCSCRLRL
jgi:hypothetical protein